MQLSYMKYILYLVLDNSIIMVIGNVRLFLIGNFKWNQRETDKSLVYVFTNQF